MKNWREKGRMIRSKEFIPHPNRKSLVLIIIKGPAMMELVHELYRRAADLAKTDALPGRSHR
jgi:hypothetical protein